MGETLPRIATVQVEKGTQIRVTWTDQTGARGPVVIDLERWIAGGGALLQSLRDPAVFGQVKVGEHGAFVTWDDDTGDLAIDAWHLETLRREQETHEAA